MITAILKPPFSVTRGKVQTATGAGSAKEGVYQATVADSVDRCSVDSHWGTSWWRRQASVTVQDTDGKPNLDLSLQGNSLRISNGTGVELDIPLGEGPIQQREAFPALSLPMHKIDFRQTGSKAEIIVNDGQVNYILRNGLICQTD